MHKMDPILLLILAGIFGSLITYFFKTVFQNRYILKTIGVALKNEIKTHSLIYHKVSPYKITDDKIKAYSKEVEYKFKEW